MKIFVVYNRVKSLAVGGVNDILADEDTVKTALAIAKELDGELFELNEKTASKLKNLDADIFFNTAFGIGGAPKSEAEVVTLLEKTGKPYTGSSVKAIILTTDKEATKNVLRAKNLPTPGNTKFPLIVKPSGEDCSLGITQASVVNNMKELDKQVTLLKKIYSEDVLVEEYIDGRELNVTILGNTVLPISEIVFGKSFDSKYKIVDFASKWEEESDSFKETTGICPAKLPINIIEKINQISLEAFRATGCRDYARVDIRLDKNNRPFILEVNANPGVGPNDGTVRSAKAAGYTYKSFLEKIIDEAINHG